MFYRRTLGKIGDAQYDIAEVENGDECLDQVGDIQPDCILLDYSLPGRNGVEVLKRLRARMPFTAVVMLTGQGSETIAVIAMREGAQNYIAKSSITTEDLHHAIQLAIAYCAMERRIDQQRISLETFTRALAHDLKEPMRTIKSYLSLLDGRVGATEKEQGYFNRIQAAAERMTALIDAVHQYTKLDGLQAEGEIAPCAVDEALEDAKMDLEELIRERSATITSADLPRVTGSATLVRQLLQNLISNALRYAGEGAHVHVDAVEAGDHWIIRVNDNGPGVDIKSRQKIFEPFIRLSRSDSGLGLGLAISKRIVDLHHGKIWCEDSALGGASFQFTLPKEHAKSPETPLAAPAAAPARATKLHDTNHLANVLVVDDSEVDIELARIMLLDEEKLRCNFLSANGADEALSLLRAEAKKACPIDLLLLDINMPGADGFELLKKLRADEMLRDVQVVMCSTSNYDKDVEQAQALGAAAYMTKPPQLRKLRQCFETMPGLRLEDEDGGTTLLRVG
jgi:signal transduction histidine kinase